MWRWLLISWALLLGGIACVAQSERVSAFWQSRDSNYNQNVVAGGGGACSQATTFLARTTGLSGTETTAYTNMICGLVTDGIITGTLSGAAGCGTVLDALYILATNTAATADLNICGTSFGLTATASPTFSADHGYTGNGSTSYLETGYDPTTAGGNWTQNAAFLSVYVLTSTAGTGAEIGLGGNTPANNYSYIQPLVTGTVSYDVNGATFPSQTSATAIGDWLATRTSSSSVTVYKNGASLGSTSDTSTTLQTNGFSIYILCYNNGGPTTCSTDQVAAAAMGGAINSTQAAAIDNRINAYMTALGINVH